MYGNAKAIETVYNGYKFRSRLEARWAVFFDSLGVEYEYEPEGFDLTEYAESEQPVYYLPDFYLPELDCFIEVKGQKPTREEEDKCMWLSEATEKRVYILWGKIECPVWYEVELTYSDYPNHYATCLYVGGDSFEWSIDPAFAWCECPKCGLIGIQYTGRSDRLPCSCDNGRECYNYDSPRLTEAYRKAKQARFEFDFRARVTQ